MSALKHIFNELKYELVNKLAEGGMGLVYEAVQKGTGNFRKTVAIKLIREEYSSIPEFQKNFIGEAKLVADLIHTNIVQTYHLGQIGGQYFMTMEFVSGVNLEQFIDRHTELGTQVPVDMAVFIASRVCRGLSYAHTKRDKEGRLLGIVHRDVNPKNVMLAIEGDVKLTDFGIAKALDLMYNEEGKVIPGKDEYLSPEGASYAVTDGRSDLFLAGHCDDRNPALPEYFPGSQPARIAAEHHHDAVAKIFLPASGHRRQAGGHYHQGPPTGSRQTVSDGF